VGLGALADKGGQQNGILPPGESHSSKGARINDPVREMGMSGRPGQGAKERLPNERSNASAYRK